MRPRTGQQLSNGRLHPAVIRSNNRASHPPSWYLLQCEASQLEAEMSHEENENNTDIDPIEVTIAAGATLSSPARASISRKRKIHVNEGKYKQRGSSSSTSSSGKGNTTCAWDRFDRLITTNDVKLHIQRHVLSSNLKQNDSQK